MLYSKLEMYDMLINFVGIDPDGLDLILKLMGDTPQTYIKVLNASSYFKTFADLEDSYCSDEEF